MKMIEVFDLMAKKEIKHETLLIVYSESVGYVYKYDKLYRTFLNDDSKRMEEDFVFGDDFLNFDVKLIPPKEKKYLIKLNAKWLKSSLSHVNYVNRGTDQYVIIGDGENLGSTDFGCYQTQFTEKELQSIQPVKEFLEDMQGKFELIEVEE